MRTATKQCAATVRTTTGAGRRRRPACRRGDARLSTPPDGVEAELAQRLSRAGCVAADEEAHELVVAAGGDADPAGDAGRPAPHRRTPGLDHGPDRLRRPAPCASTPVSTSPAGRAWSSPGAPRLDCPTAGNAVDLCTGSGAIAVALQRRSAVGPHPRHRQRPAVPWRAPGPTGSMRPAVTSSTPCRASFRERDRRRRGGGALRPDSRRFASSPATRSTSRTPRTTTVVADGTDLLRRVVIDAPAFLRPGGARAAGARWRPGRPAPAPARGPRATATSRPGPTRTATCAAWRRRSADLGGSPAS